MTGGHLLRDGASYLWQEMVSIVKEFSVHLDTGKGGVGAEQSQESRGNSRLFPTDCKNQRAPPSAAPAGSDTCEDLCAFVNFSVFKSLSPQPDSEALETA